MASGNDATYGGQLNYRVQGGSRDVIGGELDVVSGGEINLESGGSIEVASGGAINIAAGGGVYLPITAATTTVNIPNRGIVTGLVTGTSGAGANVYGIDAPVAGSMVYLVADTITNSSDGVLVTASTLIFFDAASKNSLKIILPGVIPLIGLSATRYAVACSTLIAFPTS